MLWRSVERGCRLDYPTYAKAFKKVCGRLGLALVPYQARHSGASHDRAREIRPQFEAQKRGGWKSQKSVVRYEKHGRLGKQRHRLIAEQQARFQRCRAELAAVLLHGRAVPWRGR
ncbi:unnamed protein product [Prorocentrum cordatum]|uniref:Uncharacterized protein n=1 Tax=Prorocentrum cordatum TaxID=2364126 RepID=A0ABN9RTC0_9DINO|nr:unnamed protein product [Polarella glacialis]